MTTLPPRQEWNGAGAAKPPGPKRKGRALSGSPRNTGAGNESRTRDLNLGKVALYQLSYSRTRKNYSTAAIASATYSMFFELSEATQTRPVSTA